MRYLLSTVRYMIINSLRIRNEAVAYNNWIYNPSVVPPPQLVIESAAHLFSPSAIAFTVYTFDIIDSIYRSVCSRLMKSDGGKPHSIRQPRDLITYSGWVPFFRWGLVTQSVSVFFSIESAPYLLVQITLCSEQFF